MSIPCVLCESTNTSRIEDVLVSDLVRLYEKTLHISVVSEFSDSRQISLLLCDSCGLYFFTPILTGSEAFYEKLQKFDWYYLKEKYEYSFVKKFIDEKSSVLEIGCGEGHFAEFIKPARYTGLEFSQNAILLAQKKGLNVIKEGIQAHAEIKGEHYDVVCSFQVLEHISEVGDFIEKSIRCVKPGGLFIVTVPSYDSFLPYSRNAILNMPPHHVSWWPDKTLGFVAERFGLRLLELEHEPLSDLHRDFYSSTVAFLALSNLFRRKKKMLDTSFTARVLGLLSVFLGKLYSLGIDDINLRPNGHSVTAVFLKPNKD